MIGNPISPDDQRAFNLRLVATLDALGVTYAIGGSVAAMMYSEPRFTIDVDLMVYAPLKQLNQLVREVQSWQVYITPFETIVETNLSGGLPFNIIDGTIGTKADLYIAQSTGLDASAMARRRKLVWDRATGSGTSFKNRRKLPLEHVYRHFHVPALATCKKLRVEARGWAVAPLHRVGRGAEQAVI